MEEPKVQRYYIPVEADTKDEDSGMSFPIVCVNSLEWYFVAGSATDTDLNSETATLSTKHFIMLLALNPKS
jgi:hypothetical protein